jgi:hypothetical protein
MGSVNCHSVDKEESMMIKKCLSIYVLIAFLSACASVSTPQHQYCAVADVADPKWVRHDRERDYVISKIGVVHTRESERDITKLVKYTLAQNLYSDVHAYSQSILDSTGRLVTNYQVNVATNLHLTHVKTDFKKVGKCLVAWASVSSQDAQIALANSHPINKQEHAAWELIKASQQVKDYQRHLTLYPRGLYSETAKARIDVLKKRDSQQAIHRATNNPTVRMLGQLLNNVFY